MELPKELVLETAAAAAADDVDAADAVVHGIALATLDPHSS